MSSIRGQDVCKADSNTEGSISAAKSLDPSIASNPTTAATMRVSLHSLWVPIFSSSPRGESANPV
jgi:hypothetical protein